jgi:membrane-associated protein
MHLFSFLSPEVIISTVGALGVIGIIFCETGLFFGFFFPGDSLLFTAGFLATQGYVSLPLLLFGCFLAAVVGDTVGYAFGKKVGPALFTKEDSLFFNKEHITRAQHFYEKYGKKTIILARFVPIIRTFAPIVAGIGMMPYRTFISFNIIGGLVWTSGMLILGYTFGSIIPNPDKYILPVVLVIVFVSAAPALVEIFKNSRGLFR